MCVSRIFHRHLSLLDSAIIRNGQQVSDAKGRVSSQISDGGYWFDVHIFAEDAISPESATSRFYTDSKLAWDLQSVGQVVVGSVVQIEGRSKWNSSASVEYGDGDFRYYANEDVADFLATGHGQYEGRLTHG